MTDYTPRTGSVAFRALEQLEACGPCEENLLASTIDTDVHTLKSSSTLAMANKAMRRYVGADGKWFYESLRVQAKGEKAADATQVEPAASGLPSAAIGMDPAVVLATAAGADLAKAAAQAETEETVSVHPVAAETHSFTIPELARARTEPAETAMPAEPGRHLEYALWNSGRLSIEIGEIKFDFNPSETRRLFDYLDTMLGVDRSSAS